MASITLLTKRQLAQCPLPPFNARESQRKSSGMTNSVSARTFDSIVEWDDFTVLAEQVLDLLDDTNATTIAPMEYFRRNYGQESFTSAADEVTIRGALETHLFPIVNSLADSLDLPLHYVSGGGGRSVSFADMVILHKDIPQAGLSPPSTGMHLTDRLFGDGEAKGDWQFDVDDGDSLVNIVLSGGHKAERLIHVVQQLYGYLVIDECGYGFLSNYKSTIFFKRHSNPRERVLAVSPIIHIHETPIKYYLFFLREASSNLHIKASLKKELVPITPPGQRLTLPSTTTTTRSGRRVTSSPKSVMIQTAKDGHKRRRRACDQEVWKGLKLYDLGTIGLTSKIISAGKYSSVMGASQGDVSFVVKFFNLKLEGSEDKFWAEQRAYKVLQSLQGKYIPVIIGVGIMSHVNCPFIAMLDVGLPLEKRRRTRSFILKSTEALNSIHSLGVAHRDIHPGNILVRNDGNPIFIDFGESLVLQEDSISRQKAFKDDNNKLQEVLGFVTHGATCNTRCSSVSEHESLLDNAVEDGDVVYLDTSGSGGGNGVHSSIDEVRPPRPAYT